MKKYILIVLGLVVIVAVGGLAVKADTTPSSTAVTGWAWSSNIGWISFNCSNTNACTKNNYSVTISPQGVFDGYAWSSNIGWLSFKSSDVSRCGAQASVSTTSGAVTGWMRATVATGNDGWDGCIKLSDNGIGSTFSSPDFTGKHGVTYNKTSFKFNGYGWGGPVLGWVSFTPESGQGIGCQTSCVPIPTVALAGSCTPQTNPVRSGASAIYTAQGINGAGSYKYYWNGNTSEGGSTYTVMSYNGHNNPTVIIKDANSASASPTCTDAQIAQAQGSLTLTIGSDGDDAVQGSPSQTTFQTKVGKPFGLAWNIPFAPYSAEDPNTYQCIRYAPTDDPIWATSWGDLYSNAKVSGLTASLEGVFTFTIKCTSENNAPVSTSATLRVSSSNEGEN